MELSSDSEASGFSSSGQGQEQDEEDDDQVKGQTQVEVLKGSETSNQQLNRAFKLSKRDTESLKRSNSAPLDGSSTKDFSPMDRSQLLNIALLRVLSLSKS
jgi:hypothetical protein